MKWLIGAFIALLLWSCIDARVSWSHEWGPSEGRIKNETGDVQVCLWDNLEGDLCGKWVDPGYWCRGDAMTTMAGVFKVPNKTRWVCYSWGCEAWDLYSYLRFQGASLKNGSEKYGEMSMRHFKDLMWDWSIELCE